MIRTMGGEEESELSIESERVTVARRNKGLMVGSAFGVVALAYLWDPRTAFGVLPIGLLWHPVWLVLSERNRPARVCIKPGDGGGLTVERPRGRLFVARSEVLNCWHWLDGGHDEFAVVTQRHVITVRVRDGATAEACRGALGVDSARELVATKLTGSPYWKNGGWRRRIGQSLPLLVIALGAVTTLLLNLVWPGSFDVELSFRIFFGSVLVAMIVAFSDAYAPPRIFVGSDGVALSTLGRREFIGFERIEEVRNDGSAVTLALTDGQGVVLPMAPVESSRRDMPRDRDNVRARREALAEQIDAALERFRRRSSRTDDHTNLLERGSRSLPEWHEALTRAGSYRRPQVDANDLVHVVENPRSAIEHRLGAAIALAASPEHDPSHGDRMLRVRDAISSSANSGVRMALERAAAGTLDERAYEAALTDQAATEQRTRRSRI